MRQRKVPRKTSGTGKTRPTPVVPGVFFLIHGHMVWPFWATRNTDEEAACEEMRRIGSVCTTWALGRAESSDDKQLECVRKKKSR